MYAIVDIAGQQFKVEKGQEIYVNRLEGDEGARVKFEDVMLIDNSGKIDVGTPVVAGAAVSAKIIEHLKGDKVLVFKKKRRKGYKKLNGHRDYLTKIHIENITIGAPKAKTEEVKVEKPEPKAEIKAEAKPKAAAKPKAKTKPKAKAEDKAETKDNKES